MKSAIPRTNILKKYLLGWEKVFRIFTVLDKYSDRPLTIFYASTNIFYSIMEDSIIIIFLPHYEILLFTEFATIIKTLVGGEHAMKLTKAVEDDPQRRKPDISRAKKYLNWEPKVSLNEGLRKTIEYFTKEVKRSQGGKST